MPHIRILTREEDYLAFLCEECEACGLAVTTRENKTPVDAVLVDLDAVPPFRSLYAPRVIGYTRDREPIAPEGVDTVLHRPFPLSELHALLRATAAGTAPTAPPPASPLDPTRRILRLGGHEILLSENECRIWQCLYENRGRTVARDTLSTLIEGRGGNIVDVYISYLRKKIEYPLGVKLIHTVRGVGYTIKNERNPLL